MLTESFSFYSHVDNLGYWEICFEICMVWILCVIWCYMRICLVSPYESWTSIHTSSIWTEAKLKQQTTKLEKSKVRKKGSQIRQEYFQNPGSRRLSSLLPNNQVRFRHIDQCKQGNLIKCQSLRSYLVKTPTGQIYRRNRRDILTSRMTSTLRMFEESF